jgi:hypothetical protein
MTLTFSKQPKIMIKKIEIMTKNYKIKTLNFLKGHFFKVPKVISNTFVTILGDHDFWVT